MSTDPKPEGLDPRVAAVTDELCSHEPCCEGHLAIAEIAVEALDAYDADHREEALKRLGMEVYGYVGNGTNVHEGFHSVRAHEHQVQGGWVGFKCTPLYWVRSETGDGE